MTVLVYIVLCLIWGSTWLAIKIGLTDAPPLTSAAARYVLATIILLIIALVKRHPFPGTLREKLHVAYPGIYIYFASYALVYTGEQYISSALTSVLFASFPFFVALLSLRFIPRETLRPLAWFGLVLGFAGIVVVSYDSLQLSTDIFLGSLLILAASFVASYGMILVKRFHTGRDIVSTAVLQVSAGTLLLLITSFIFEQWSDLRWSQATIGSIVYLAVFGTVVAFLGYYWLLKRTTVVVVSLIAFITPIIAIFLGLLAYGESLTPAAIAGTGMILTGIILAIKRQK